MNENENKVVVNEADVREIIKMMKADLTDGSVCEKLEENKFGSVEEKEEKPQDLNRARTPLTLNNQPATASSVKLDDEEFDPAGLMTGSNNQPENDDELERLAKADKLMANFDDDYDERVCSVMTKTTAMTTKLELENDDEKNYSIMATTAPNANYDIITDLNQLKMNDDDQQEEQQQQQQQEDIENESGLNSARSLVKKSAKIQQQQQQQQQEQEHIEDDYYEEQTRQDLADFIGRAIEFGANALDLSKKNLSKLPRELLHLSCDLQYLYLEGNHLEKLPSDFFAIFTSLIWLDLRNNSLAELPSIGLEKHKHLRYLLLENNKLHVLPNEIANLRQLTALSLADNPLIYPPNDVIERGFRYVQEFLRTMLVQRKFEAMRNNNKGIGKSIEHEDENENEDEDDIKSYCEDVWATSDEEREDQQQKQQQAKQQRSRLTKSATRFATAAAAADHIMDSPLSYFRGGSARLDTATRRLLIAHSIQPVEAEIKKQMLKERLNKAKLNANELSKNGKKLLAKRKTLPPSATTEASLFKNEKFEKAYRAGKLDSYKSSKEKIDAKLQKINDKHIVDEFRDELKVKQRKLLNKRLVKGVDYVEPVLNAPFDISEDHLTVMTNEERAYCDAKIEEELRRPLSPSTLWRIEEERRIRDNLLQDKIRDYTKKVLSRGNKKSENPKFDRIEAAKDLKELKQIEKELEQRRTELQFNLRAHTGTLAYRETAKLNSKATLKNVLKKKN